MIKQVSERECIRHRTLTFFSNVPYVYMRVQVKFLCIYLISVCVLVEPCLLVCTLFKFHCHCPSATTGQRAAIHSFCDVLALQVQHMPRVSSAFLWHAELFVCGATLMACDNYQFSSQCIPTGTAVLALALTHADMSLLYSTAFLL